jgi:hypothetical protein
MNTSIIEIQEARAQEVQIDDESLIIALVDGRTIIAPIVWYPRLWYGNKEERQDFQILGDGSHIHWPALDEDLSVMGILAGRRSGESAKSLKKWLTARGVKP